MESFKSTLDEVREADILLHVVDISHPQYENISSSEQDVGRIRRAEKPTVIFLKMDNMNRRRLISGWSGSKKGDTSDLKERWQMKPRIIVCYSATERQNIDNLRQTILNKVRDMYQVRYPYRAEFFY